MGRKTIFLGLGLFVVLALIYLGSNRFSGDKTSFNNTLKSGRITASTTGQVLGAEVVKGAMDGVDALISKTGQVVKNSVFGLAKDVGNSAKEQLTEAIFGSSTPSASQIEVVTQAGSVVICPSYPKNQNISYVLKFASAATNQSYSVDWGDGRVTRGKTDSPEISFSHSYGSAGNYKIIFKTGTFEAQKEVCVE